MLGDSRVEFVLVGLPRGAIPDLQAAPGPVITTSFFSEPCSIRNAGIETRSCPVELGLSDPDEKKRSSLRASVDTGLLPASDLVRSGRSSSGVQICDAGLEALGEDDAIALKTLADTSTEP